MNAAARLPPGVAGGALLAALARLDAELPPHAPQQLQVDDVFAGAVAPGDPPGPQALATLVALAERMGWRLVDRSEHPDGGALPAQRVQARLRFVRGATPHERLVPVGAGQAEAMRALFADVFGQPMSAQHWQWKYGGGRGLGVGLRHGDELVAHYGGVRRRVRWAGRDAVACQICDVMVAPKANRALVRRGAMHAITATFLETELGWGRTHALAFGFPSDRHHALARRLHLYAGVDQLVELRWPAAAGAAPARLVAIDRAGLAPGGRGETLAARLWQGMAAALPTQVVGVRDAAWLRHRYLDHPGVAYELLRLERGWTRRPQGLLVLRTHETHLMLVDLVAPPAAWPALVAAARQRAAAAGRPELRLWITASQQAAFAAIDPAAVQVVPLGITIPANVHTPGPVDEVAQRWFLMAGDADFT